jgi:O-antigen/teichoic acid export membrane protein/O-antigen ligase
MPDGCVLAGPGPIVPARSVGGVGSRPGRLLHRVPLDPPLVLFGAFAYVASEFTALHPLRKLLPGLPLVAVLLAIAHVRTHPRDLKPFVPVGLLAFFAWVIVSYSWTVDPHDSAHQILEYLGVSLTGMILGLVLDKESLVRVVSLGSRFFVGMTSVALLVAYRSSSLPPAVDPAPGWHGPLGGKNELGFLMALALITFVCERKMRRVHPAWFVLAVVLLLGSQSGAGLCVALMAVSVAIWGRALTGLRDAPARLGFKLLSLAVLAAGILFLLTDFPAATSVLGKNATLTGRTKIWAAVISGIRQQPLHGFGYASVWLNKTGETAVLWSKIGFEVFESHDVYLDLLLQLGVIGFALAILPIAGALRRLLPRIQDTDGATQWMVLILLALLLEGVVESDFIGNDMFLVAAVVAASMGLRAGLTRRNVTTLPVGLGGEISNRGWPVEGLPRLLAAPSRKFRRPSLPMPSVSSIRGRIGGSDHSLLADLGWGTIFEVASLGGSVIAFVGLARQLGPVTYGYYSAVAGIVGLLGTVVNGWASFVILENTLRDGVDVQDATGSVTAWVSIGAALSMGLTIAVGHMVLPDVSLVVLVCFAAATVVGGSLVALCSSVMQSVNGFAVSARGRIALQLLLVLVTIGLWAGQDLTLLTFAVSSLIAYLVVGLWYLTAVRRSCGFIIRPGRPRWADLGRGGLYGSALLFFAIEEDVDKPLLVALGKRMVAGPYAAAYNIVTMGLLPLNAATAATHNRFLQDDPSVRGEHLKRSLRFTAPAAVYGLVAVIGLELGAPLAPHILGPAYRGTTEMIRLLAFIVLFRALTVFPFNGLMGLGRGGWRICILGTSAVLNVGLNIALIPVFSYKGAVIATLAGECAFVLLTWIGLIIFQRRADREEAEHGQR